MRSLAVRGLGDLRLAASTRAVWFGFLGTALILLGSLSPAYLPQASPVWDVLRELRVDTPTTRWVGTIATLGGLALLLEAWFRLRPARRRAAGKPQLSHWAVLSIIALPLLFGPPAFSHDAYSYAAHGWLIENNLSPYLVGPGLLPGAYADQVAWVWRETTAPYGPLSLWLSHGIVSLAGFDPYLSALMMRVPALAGVAMIGLTVPRIARRLGVDAAAASWFSVLNPILIIDFVGGAHNDALMVGIMLVGVWVTMTTRWWWVGALIVGVAAAVKQPAFLVAVALPFLVKPWSSWRPLTVMAAATRALASLGIAVAVFALISVLSGQGFGWIYAITVPGMVDTLSPFTVLGRMLDYPLGLVGASPGGRGMIMMMQSVGAVLSAVGIAVIAWRHLGQRPLHFVSWSFLWFALCAPALHSWYLLWGGVLLPMTRPTSRALRVAIIATVFLLAFAAVNFSLRNEQWWFVLALVVIAYWIMHTHELSQPMEEGTGQEMA